MNILAFMWVLLRSMKLLARGWGAPCQTSNQYFYSQMGVAPQTVNRQPISANRVIFAYPTPVGEIIGDEQESEQIASNFKELGFHTVPVFLYLNKKVFKEDLDLLELQKHFHEIRFDSNVSTSSINWAQTKKQTHQIKSILKESSRTQKLIAEKQIILRRHQTYIRETQQRIL